MSEVGAQTSQAQLRERLEQLGFDVVRFAQIPAQLPEASPPHGLRAWLAAGMQADMHWMERTADKRLNPELVLPGARSVIVLGVSYWSERHRRPSSAGPQWARYALYEDYHDTMKPGLVAAGLVLEELYGVAGTDYRFYVDTGPVLDRAWAARAGVGFTGKNAMLISREHGNWLFLAAILTRITFEPDPPLEKKLTLPAIDPTAAEELAPPVGLLCGKCTRCLDACPTDAFAAPGVVDSRRCISYHTIENKGIIPRELRAGIGDRIYGCDICLAVCPWNRFAQQSHRLLLSARDDIAELSLRELLALTPERFAQVFRATPIKRLKLVGLLRNACVVAGNSGDTSLVPELLTLAREHASPIVRAHAVWAVRQLGAGEQLVEIAAHETDPAVLEEFADSP